MLRFYACFYVWGQIDPDSLNRHKIIEIEKSYTVCVPFLLSPKLFAFYP